VARRAARGLLRHASPTVRQRARTVTAVSAPPAPPDVARPPAPSAAAALAHALSSGDQPRVIEACQQVVRDLDRGAVAVLLDHLRAPTRQLAQQTLTQLGDAITGTLGDVLVDTRVAARVRRDVALVLGAISTPAAIAQLQRVPALAEPSVLQVTLRRMSAARKGDVAVLLDDAALRADITIDLEIHVRRQSQHAAAAAVAAGGPDLDLLCRALLESGLQARERAFRRLALVYPAREMLRAHRGLNSADDGIRAHALEYLEATLTPADRDLILPVLREAPRQPDDAGDPPPSRAALVETLMADHEPWLVTLAVHVAAVGADHDLREAVARAPVSDAISQATQKWALARL